MVDLAAVNFKIKSLLDVPQILISCDEALIIFD